MKVILWLFGLKFSLISNLFVTFFLFFLERKEKKGSKKRKETRTVVWLTVPEQGHLHVPYRGESSGVV
ncbi:MAG: hypothetical protein EBS19_15045 [Spirochaetia bacterium]|nr:hypothetical protein [Spirochaetia bacterium]